MLDYVIILIKCSVYKYYNNLIYLNLVFGVNSSITYILVYLGYLTQSKIVLISYNFLIIQLSGVYV
jgi:hypothetical protein